MFTAQATGRSYMETVSWIPEPFCVVGKVLKLKFGEDDAWDNGWTVITASERQPHSLVEKMARVYLKTRKYSDI